MPRQVNGDREISYKIVEHIGIIGVYQTKWQKELNIVIWNGTNPKYDIRDWDSSHQKMSKGITLHKEEAEKLYAILKEHFEKPINSNGSTDVNNNSLPEEASDFIQEEAQNPLPDVNQFASIENQQENEF